MTTPDRTAIDRVWSVLSPAARRTLEMELPPADLRSLQLDLARTRAAEVTPAAVLRQRDTDRFVRPSDADPRLLSRVEARLWDLLPEHFVGVELSPVVPLGTCSAISTVDQNRVVSTGRGTEVLSDPTNALAVEAAYRRRGTPAQPIHLAAAHRVLRAQPPTAPGTSAHFLLFALVSSARDRGSGRTEADLLVEHLSYWQRVLGDLVARGRPRMTCSSFVGGPVDERIADTVLPALAHGATPVEPDPDRQQGRGYYAGAALRLLVDVDGVRVEVGDGGLTNWTAQLAGNAKERCLVSCASVERLGEFI